MERAPPRRGRPLPNPRHRRGGRGRPLPPPPPPPHASRPRNRRRKLERERPPPAPTVTIKLIVRRLPPNLSAEQFAKVADPVGASKAIWKSFAPGSASEGGGLKKVRQVSRHGVAHLGFASWPDAGTFADAFDGFRFAEEGEGGTYIARVERAMSQAVPPLQKRKPIPLEGMIENDSDYVAFVKKLEEERRKEVNHSAALSVTQTAAIFPGKAQLVDKEVKNKAKVNLTTPLIEDVRARRKERDQKKKSTKPIPRPPRAKGRPIVVSDPSAKTDAAAKAAASARRKKQRRGDFGGPSKKAEEPATPLPRKGGRVPLNGRRPGPTVERRDSDHKPLNGSIYPNPNLPYHYVGSSASAPNGHNGSEKGSISRSGRSRSGRGGRSRGKPGSSMGSIGHRSPTRDVKDTLRASLEVSHGPVRLLRKETSNGNKT